MSHHVRPGWLVGTPDGWADRLGDERGSVTRYPSGFFHLRAWPSGGF